jgi:hypothetical protein
MMKEEIRRVESPLPVLITQMLDETIAQRREKAKEIKEANKVYSNSKQLLPVDKPQFIRTSGSSINYIPESQITSIGISQIPSVKNANSDYTSTIVSQTNRVENKRTTFRSNYYEVNEYEERTSNSRTLANVSHHIEEESTYLKDNEDQKSAGRLNQEDLKSSQRQWMVDQTYKLDSSQLSDNLPTRDS